MRFDLVARQIMAPALGVALAATVAACSSSSSTSTSSGATSSAAAPASSSASAAASSSGPASSGNSAAAAQIKANWEEFFDGKTPTAKRLTLLQNGQKFAAAIRAFSSLGSTASAQVTKVVVDSPSKATVTYNILLGGKPALSNRTGTAVYEGGTWKVGDASFCQLLTLAPGSQAPAACKSS
jgi:hypothetical protein